MQFEEALALMREGKTVLDPDGKPWKLENGEFLTYMAADSCDPEWHINNYLNNHDILGEWTTKEKQKFQYLYRAIGNTYWKAKSSKFESEEEALRSFYDPRGLELRRIEP